MRQSWLWPVVILLSAVAAGLFTFVLPNTPLRPVIVLWFLFICPGMVLVQALHLKSPIIELTLALALSFAIDAIVAAIQLYGGGWSPAGTMEIVMGLSIGGAIVLLLTMRSTTAFAPKQLPGVLLGRRGILITFSLALLIIGICLGSVGTSFGSYLLSQNSHSAASTAFPLARVTPRSSTGTIATATPSTPFPFYLATSYVGTIYDIPTATKTNFSLTIIQQQQENISGYFSGLHISGTFIGNINATRHIQFMATTSRGQTTFSFEGMIYPGSVIAGTYCEPASVTGTCRGYGVWSLSPTS